MSEAPYPRRCYSARGTRLRCGGRMWKDRWWDGDGVRALLLPPGAVAA